MKLSKREWGLVAQGGQALLAGISIGLLVYSAVQISSAYRKSYDFEEAARKEGRLAAVSFRQPEAVREEILEKAQGLGLAVDRERIRVTASQKPTDMPVGAMAAIVANQNQNDLPTVGAVNIDVYY